MGDTLQVGEELGLGQALQGGAYTLTLQNDGNLVLSEPDGTVVWATMTHERGVERAVLQEDGNFVLYSGSGPVWATDTNGQAADRLVLQSDRNLVLYGRDGASLWASGTNTDNPIVVEESVAAPAASRCLRRRRRRNPAPTPWRPVTRCGPSRNGSTATATATWRSPGRAASRIRMSSTRVSC